ncbi:MAG: ActS/PrrB/RegB family redox-sensitive histidine kinase [Pseudomonadota bacterium]
MTDKPQDVPPFKASSLTVGLPKWQQEPSLQGLGALAASNSQRVRLKTLVRLRWLAIAGQLIAVFAVAFGFQFPLPFVECLMLIASSGGLNAWMGWAYPRSTRISDKRAAVILGFDLIQLAALLYLTGGLDNPFSILLLAPVLISATILRLPTTIWLGTLASMLITVLALWHFPLPWADGSQLVFPVVYRLGVWVALLIAIGFICTYAWNVTRESRNLTNALAATELALQREQHLSELDGMAAAAAHELGTPLATITVVAKELAREVDPSTPLGEDIELIRSQAERCRTILTKLASLGGGEDTVITTKSLEAVLDDLVDPHRAFAVPIDIVAQGEGAPPLIRTDPALSYGIGNLIENGVNFAQSRVRVVGSWGTHDVSILIEDDGPGFPSDVLSRLGEPFVSKRERSARPQTETSGGVTFPAGLGSASGGGLGLGFFIAKTLLERAGARVSVRNGGDTLKGASVTVHFERSTLDRTPKLTIDPET